LEIETIERSIPPVSIESITAMLRIAISGTWYDIDLKLFGEKKIFGERIEKIRSVPKVMVIN
jgi:hypothetical protein